MEKYYFDTSVWLAYLLGNEQYSPEAKKWFEKITNSDAMLVSSEPITFEIKSARPETYGRYLVVCKELSSLGKLKFVEVSEEDERLAHNYSKMGGFGYGDVLHMRVAKRNELHAVSADIRHWPKIARMLEVYDFSFVTDINR
jgi:predicted nucleic acid-binding protein